MPLSPLRSALFGACALTLAALAQVPTPSWWSTRGALDPQAAPDDYAALNQGQLKNLARAAFEEMQAKLPGGAGPELTALIASWDNPGPETDDYAVVTAGQLKNLADPFYARLESARASLASGWTAIQAPWAGQPSESPGNTELVNIGQAKQLFAGLEGDRATRTPLAFYDPVTGQVFAGQSGTAANGTPFIFGFNWLGDTDSDSISDLDEVLFESNPLSGDTPNAASVVALFVYPRHESLAQSY